MSVPATDGFEWYRGLFCKKHERKFIKHILRKKGVPFLPLPVYILAIKVIYSHKRRFPVQKKSRTILRYSTDWTDELIFQIMWVSSW